jgi:hypothetical protein
LNAELVWVFLERMMSRRVRSKTTIQDTSSRILSSSEVDLDVSGRDGGRIGGFVMRFGGIFRF